MDHLLIRALRPPVKNEITQGRRLWCDTDIRVEFFVGINTLSRIFHERLSTFIKVP